MIWNNYTDPIFNVPENFLIFTSLIKEIFGDNTTIIPATGIKNKDWDCKLNNVFDTTHSLTCEVKMRKCHYNDIALEVLQYEEHIEKYKQYMRWQDEESAINYVRSSKSGWILKTKAQIVVQITPSCIYILKTKRIRDYLIKNFFTLETKFCYNTTGSMSKIVKIDESTKDFIVIKYSDLLKQFKFRGD